MSKAIEAVSVRLTPGTQMECLENTYIPERKGAILTIRAQGKRVFSSTVTETRGGVAHRAESRFETACRAPHGGRRHVPPADRARCSLRHLADSRYLST